ncbi:hypothetical protein FRC01_003451 [Tulasnella sp. 417]|nr:hypothetical protein FRC01_003451 [Tulasnella sp. 417]
MQRLKQLLVKRRLKKVSSVSEEPSPEPGPTTPRTSLQAEREAWSAQALSEHHQTLAIKNLPQEVLEVMFSEEAASPWGDYQPLFCLRAVCKDWMEIIDSTPDLWRAIKSIFHPEFQAMILRNSRKRTLFVTYDERLWTTDPSGEEKMEAFASLMRPTADRWRELKYYPVWNSKSAGWMLSLPFHNLHRLDVQGDGLIAHRQPLDAPKLQTLAVTHGSLQWRSFSGLISLILEQTDATLNDFVAVLQASPGLYYLSLKKTWLKLEAEDPQDAAISKILLPKLHHLFVYRSSARSLSLLLDRIEAPDLGHFSITQRYKYDPEDCTRLFELAAPYIGIFPFPKCEKQHRVVIRVREWEIELAIGERRIIVWTPTWTSENGPRERMRYLTSFLEHLDDRVCETVNVLCLGGWGDGEIGGYLGILHARFPQINELAFEAEWHYGRDMDVLCGHLTSSVQLGLGEEWLLPKLTKLTLDYGIFWKGGLDQLLQLVETRRSARHVEAIEELRLDAPSGGVDSSTMEMLRCSINLVEIYQTRVRHSFTLH